MDLYSPDAEFTRRADDPHGNFASVGDKQSADIHGRVVSAVNIDKRLPDLNGVAVLDQESDDAAARLGSHLVEGLHHFDEAHDVAGAIVSPTSLNGGWSGEGQRKKMPGTGEAS